VVILEGEMLQCMGVPKLESPGLGWAGVRRRGARGRCTSKMIIGWAATGQQEYAQTHVALVNP